MVEEREVAGLPALEVARTLPEDPHLEAASHGHRLALGAALAASAVLVACGGGGGGGGGALFGGTSGTGGAGGTGGPDWG